MSQVHSNKIRRTRDVPCHIHDFWDIPFSFTIIIFVYLVETTANSSKGTHIIISLYFILYCMTIYDIGSY